MPSVGFEPTISAGEWVQTYALDRTATGTGNMCKVNSQKVTVNTKTLKLTGKIEVKIEVCVIKDLR